MEAPGMSGTSISDFITSLRDDSAGSAAAVLPPSGDAEACRRFEMHIRKFITAKNGDMTEGVAKVRRWLEWASTVLPQKVSAVLLTLNFLKKPRGSQPPRSPSPREEWRV